LGILPAGMVRRKQPRFPIFVWEEISVPKPKFTVRTSIGIKIPKRFLERDLPKGDNPLQFIKKSGLLAEIQVAIADFSGCGLIVGRCAAADRANE
jgi:hypothetical protein